MAKQLLVRFICTIKNTAGLKKCNIPNEIYIPLTRDVPSDGKKLRFLIQKLWMQKHPRDINFDPKNEPPTIEVTEILTSKIVERDA